MDPDRSLTVAPFRGTPAEWDRFVREQRGWTHFHLHGWRAVMERVFDHECLYLAAHDDAGTLAAVLPLVRVKSVLFGHYLVSMPFLNYGGPLGSPAGVAALAGEARRLADAGDAKLLELRSRVELPLALPVSHRKITVVLDMPAGNDPAALWQALGSKLRSQIKRPQKEGVTVRFGPDQVAPFFSIFSRHMRDLGTPTQPRALFDAIAKQFGESVWFGCAYLGSEAVAGGCAFRWDDEVEMTWASSLTAHKRLAPNMLLYWSFMERAMREGMRTFNFGRCTPGAGTHQFKRQWGSRDEQLWWYQHSPRGVAATPSPEANAYAWGPRAWKRLPVGIATALGPRIVRFIP
ncbi:MAG TPA: FemAB family XrtA/PEP-CTERM system-associated protein [Gemmatimonadales bacterium]|nr:FemAB family XrtA/PEP-CTERM system-associated protein [Gemmatimonadales bacterium]